MPLASALFPVAHALALALSFQQGTMAPSGVPDPAATPPPPHGVPGETALPPPPPPPTVRRYGDRGTSELAIGGGYSSVSGFVAAAGFRHFVADGVAPGAEVTYIGGGSNSSQLGLVLADLRLVPVRSGTVALVLTPRAGRVLISDHSDGWAIGASAGLIVFVSRNAGFELGYEMLRLTPASFCSDLSTCVLHGPVLGLRFAF